MVSKQKGVGMKNTVMQRRQLLKLGASAGAALGLASLAKAKDLCLGKTPPQTEGPFYPVLKQKDTDWDLIQVDGRKQKARGEEIVVVGQVLDQYCNPVADVLVEIWQACDSGKYNHPNDPNPAPLDPDFQYWGRSLTDNEGHYTFRTILPGAYPADTDWTRPPHIHFKIHKRGFMELTTQLYFEGNALNSADKILLRIPKIDHVKVVRPIEVKDAKLPNNEVLKNSRIITFNIELEKL
jgi:protocatechuate 3,4-dioxygenase beta subunit